MFSWKNIKTTIRQKIVNGENNTGKALGVAEVIGKTIASGGSAIAKATPHVISHLMNDVIKNSNDDDKKEKAQNIQNQMKNKINENENSPSSQDRELSELKKYEEQLKKIQLEIKHYEAAEKRADAKMNEIFLKLGKASGAEKITLNAEKDELFSSIKKGHSKYLKLIAKENQISCIIDDYKDNN